MILASAARSGTFLTAPAFVPSGHNVTCFLANGGSKPARDALVEVLRYDVVPPAEVEVSDAIDELLPLGYLSAVLTNAGATAVYMCRFVFKGSAKALRGTMVLRDGALAIVDSHEAH